MANKPLKTIKFPGLDDTYTIPQKTSDITNDSGFQTDEDVSDAISDNIDDTLSTTGKSADAKAVGDKIAELETESMESHITNTSSGSIASFTDGADDIPVKDLTFHISPIQDLHGYDHPWPEGGGKNMLKVTATTQTINGVTFTVNDDGTIVVNGTATADATLRLFDGTGDFTNCIISGCPSGGATSTYYSALSNVTITSLIDVGTERVITIENTGRWIYNITIKNGYTANNLVFKPMIRLASETDATFAPYSNICPISGWTEIEGVRSGKNLLNAEDAEIGIAWNGSSNTARVRLIIPIKPNADYILSMSGENNLDGIYKTLSTVVPPSGISNLTFPYNFNSEANTYLVLGFNKENISQNDIELLKLQLETGSTTTDYEPSHVTQIPISWQSEAGTVYGGYVDVTEGKLVVDRAMVTYSSSDGFANHYSNRWYHNGLPDGADYAKRTNAVSNQAIYQDSALTYIALFAFGSSGVYINKLSDDETIEEFSARLSANPFQICYELATQQEYSLTPQQVNSLLGENHIWCDSGETEVEYRADTKLYIDGKIAELQALILEI